MLWKVEVRGRSTASEYQRPVLFTSFDLIKKKAPKKGFFLVLWKVEVRGVEPRSEKATQQISTCLAVD